jgi:AtzE family amidohydrolase
MSDPLRADATAGEIAAAVRAGAITASAVVDAALTRIEAHNPAINAFTALAAARARERALQLDQSLGDGLPSGELAGVPFGVKAMVDVAGLTTTAGSALYLDTPPAARDAAVVRALEAAGAVCVGALNMDEFGMGGTTENACFGPTHNPHDLARTSGGSSGGCAAAVAAGMVPLAIGSDGLGSIRLPASLCGVYGLRPTRGLISDEGVLGAGGTIATIGPLARSAADVARCLRALRTEKVVQPPESHVPGIPIRLATAGGYFRQGLDQEVADAVERVTHALGITREIEFPQPRLARAAATLVNASESAEGKLDALRHRLDAFDPSTRERFLAHALIPVQWYLHAQRFRCWHIAEVMRIFDEIDVLVVPATPCIAPPLGTPTLRIGGTELPTGPALGWFTQPLAGTDCPALTVPIARPGHLPIGIQLFGPPGREDLLLRIAAQLEVLGVAAASIPRAWQ